MLIDNIEDSYVLTDALDLPVIESSGGLVVNDSHHILLIFKRGKWDMAKGRLEPSQGKEVTALREVNEETGLNIDQLSIKAKLVSTYHTTRHQNKKYLKKTHWYLMQYNGSGDEVNPQIEEGIIECRWVHLSDLPKYRDHLRPRIEYVVDFWHQNLAYIPRA